MINPKNICVSACIGFFLSFLIGLFSDVHFSVVVLRALLFAVVFAALCVGISILYQKFLSADNGGFIVDPEPSSLKNPAGGVVNIVVDDSNLPDEDMSPKFTVLNNHSALDNEIKKTSGRSEPAVESVPVSPPSPVVSAEPEEKPPFKPVSLGESEPKAAPVSSVPSSNVPEAASSNTAASNAAVSDAPEEEQQLDELPDISNMAVEASGDVASDLDSPTDEIVSDSEFATGGAKMKEQPISGDTAVMAKAIQTLLAKDN